MLSNMPSAERAARAGRSSATAAAGLNDESTPGRLMRAAADAFASKGFHATTTRDIASRAGLSPAGVYVHFPSKEELLFALSRQGHAAARDMLVEAHASAEGPREALLEVVTSFTRWHAEHHEVARIVQYEFPHLTPEHRAEVLALRKEIDAVVQSILSEGVAAGEFAVDDVADTALALMSLVVDVARWYSPTITRTPEQIAEANAALALRLVAA